MTCLQLLILPLQLGGICEGMVQIEVEPGGGLVRQGKGLLLPTSCQVDACWHPPLCLILQSTMMASRLLLARASESVAQSAAHKAVQFCTALQPLQLTLTSILCNIHKQRNQEASSDNAWMAESWQTPSSMMAVQVCVKLLLHGKGTCTNSTAAQLCSRGACITPCQWSLHWWRPPCMPKALGLFWGALGQPWWDSASTRCCQQVVLTSSRKNLPAQWHTKTEMCTGHPGLNSGKHDQQNKTARCCRPAACKSSAEAVGAW